MNKIELEQLRLALLEQDVTSEQWSRALETVNAKNAPRYRSWEELFAAMPPSSEESKRDLERFLDEEKEENAAMIEALEIVYERRRQKNAT